MNLGAGGQEVGHARKDRFGRFGRFGEGWGRLFQLRQPLLYSTIVRELPGHGLEYALGRVRHPGEGERVGAEQPDPEPEEATVELDWEGGQCPEGGSAILLVHDERLDGEQARARVVGIPLRQLADQAGGLGPA